MNDKVETSPTRSDKDKKRLNEYEASKVCDIFLYIINFYVFYIF